MELNDNIVKLCGELKLPTTCLLYTSVATTAAKESWTYVEFLNELLQIESSAKLLRVKTTLTKFAGFPTIKTLEQFDYNFTVGVNSKQVNELASLEFIKKMKISYF
jgi:DNA replication protein